MTTVFVTGATGLIGGALVHALQAAGHTVVVGVRDVAAAHRRWPGCRAVAVDFARDQTAEAWTPRLAGIDVVVNAVGLFRETREQTFEALHVRAPSALFDACVIAGVAHVVQLSALGADEHADTAYHRSKREADRHLASLPLAATIVQPSLVFAPHGASSRWFLRLATLPLVPLPGGGVQRVAPIALGDLVSLLVSIIGRERDAESPRVDEPLTAPSVAHRTEIVAAVGPECMRLRDYLDALRRALGLGALRVMPVPMSFVRIVARVVGAARTGFVDPDALAMLERGNCAPAADIAHRLGRAPRPASAFIEPRDATPTRRAAQLANHVTFLRIAVALVWIVTGIVSFGLYPVADSLALLARVGLEGFAATIALYGAAALDLAFGVGTLALRKRRWLYRLQIALILGYTAIITVFLPEYWLHPYGPVLKNLPMLAALWLLHDLDDDAWTT